jgi:addiction module HigA family antidote
MTNKMRPIHPGEQLQDELDELGMSGAAFATAIHVPANRITEILRQKRGITADTALRLARYFSTTADYWMNLQKAYELRLAEQTVGTEISKIVKPRAA